MAFKLGPLENNWEIPYFQRSWYENIFNMGETSYITENGLYKEKKFDAKTAPLKLISMNAKDGLLETFSWRQRFNDFRAYEVHKHTGMTFIEFLELPRFIVEETLNILREDRRMKERVMSQADEGKLNNDSMVENFIKSSAYR